MFWAVQGMAAELSTGALVMAAIKESDQNISMLVANNKATFSKKAKRKNIVYLQRWSTSKRSNRNSY